MRTRERWEYLSRGPRIAWDALVRGQYRFDFDFMPIHVRGMSLAQRANLLKSGLNLGYRRLRPWSRPLHMQMELTSFCNLECPVCPTGTGELHRDAKSMDVELFERLMSQVGRYLLTMSLWGWGESLLHKRLGRFLEIARRYPAAVLLSTNGQNLNQSWVQEALTTHPPTYLIAAIDGLTDETNSVYRRGAKLRPALEGVRELADWKRRTGAKLPVLHLRFMAMKQNEHELPHVREFARDAGFDMVSIRSLSIIDSTENQHRDLIPLSDLLKAYTYDGGKRVRRDDFVCQHAFTFPTMMADGRIVSCEQDFNVSQPYGTFTKDRDFDGIWYSQEASAIRETVRDRPEDFSFCRNCPYADRPISSCSLESYALRPLEV
jgi:radical SAM protein with 4Fe4S-binding SPASM domain